MTGISRLGILRTFIWQVQVFDFGFDLLLKTLFVLPSLHIYIGYRSSSIYQFILNCCYISKPNTTMKYDDIIIIGKRYIEQLHYNNKKPAIDYYYDSYYSNNLIIDIVCSHEFSQNYISLVSN